MLIGYLKKENNKQRDIRTLWWTITKGWADPKTLPANELIAWPIKGDPAIKRLTHADAKRMDKRFRSLKWKVV